MSGAFTDNDTLVINYNQIARINDIEIKFRFAGKVVKIDLLEKAGHDQIEFLGQQQ